jgi:hypothetical protein
LRIVGFPGIRLLKIAVSWGMDVKNKDFVTYAKKRAPLLIVLLFICGWLQAQDDETIFEDESSQIAASGWIVIKIVTVI